MSWIDSIVDFGSNLLKNVTGSGVVGGVAKSAALGFLLKKVTDSINKDNQPTETATNNRPDPGVRLQVDPDTEHAIPLVYGQAYLGGIVTDAAITNSNQTMWYCITICEKTGNLISGTPSQISFEDMYWDQNKITFQSDGITVASFTDDSGNVNTNPAGLIKIYCFSGNSSSPVVPRGYSNGALAAAYSLMPNWTTDHDMNDLVFALVRVDYNKEKNVTGLGTIDFKMKNTMSQAGDVLYDYMTNTRYGAGIDPTEIYVL